MKKKRLLVYSVDAMVKEDLDYLKTKEHFGAFLPHCSGPESVQTIYPSITYPAHVSIETGCYPDRSGVYNNLFFNTVNSFTDWIRDYRFIKADTIFSAARREGYTTASAFWPVTAHSPDIDFNMTESWFTREGETLPEALVKMGASEQLADIMGRYTGLLVSEAVSDDLWSWDSEPEFDNFMIHVACDMIRECRPEVMFMHGCVIDSFRHRYGIFGPKINEGLDILDEGLGMLLQALKDAGTYDDTNIVILSDHGQQNVVRVVRPNIYLVDRGFITLDSSCKVADYSAFGMSTGMSMTFRLKNPEDKAVHDRVYALLKELADEGIYGFSEVFTRQEAAERFHLDGDFAFIAEGDDYTSFSDGWTRPVVSNVDLRDYHRTGRGSHGYLPDKGPQPVFLAKGPDIVPGVILPRRPIVDEGPTFAGLLGADLKDAQGTAMTELLKT